MPVPFSPSKKKKIRKKKSIPRREKREMVGPETPFPYTAIDM